MTKKKSSDPQWREFEKIVARIEATSGPNGLIVKSPDRIKCKVTGRPREVDASIRGKFGTSDVLITVECRKRSRVSDVTWIEQLANKKENIGADRTIAVSSNGFSTDAKKLASFRGIDLRLLSDISIENINDLMKIDFVLFTHKRCEVVKAVLRIRAEGQQWRMPVEGDDYVEIPHHDPVLFEPVFRNNITGYTFYLNDLWLDLQKLEDVFRDVPRNGERELKTACFPFYESVAFSPNDESQIISDVLLTIALWFEVERVDIATAKKVEYAQMDGQALQRLEFASGLEGMGEWNLAVQLPKGATDLIELRTQMNVPSKSRGR